MGIKGQIVMHTFSNKEALVEAMVIEILSDLDSSVKQFGSANLLLSGGSTPSPFYNLLDEKCDFLDKINIGLIDERYVETTSDYSNEKYIRNCFHRHSTRPNIKGMVFTTEGESQNLSSVKTEYQEFIHRTDIAILGMGADGHTASIFPNDPHSDLARRDKTKDIYSTKAPTEPIERITCSLELILGARDIYLLFFGKEKYDVLLDESRTLPIHDVLQRRNDIKFYYLDND